MGTPAKERQRKLRNERKSQGLCTECGLRPPNKPNRCWCRQCLDKHNQWYHQSEYKERRKKIRQKNRIDVIDYYGGKCSCCGETELCFLALDHIDGGGNDDRKKRGFGSGFYAKIVRQGFPEGFQVLCHNCNFGRHLNGGICPHEHSRSM